MKHGDARFFFLSLGPSADTLGTGFRLVGDRTHNPRQ